MATTQTNAQSNAVANGVQNGHALANIEQASKPIAPRVSHVTLVSSIIAAAASFRSAINTEVAVCLSVFAQAKGTGTAAKKELYSIYKEAGYDCEVGGTGKDYKTVNRRMNYASKFFESLKEGDVEEMMGDENREQLALQSIVNHLTQKFNFRSMNDVLAAAGVETPTAAKKRTRKPEPSVADMKKGAEPPIVPVTLPEGLPKTVVATYEATKKRVEGGDAPTERQASILAKHKIAVPIKTPAPATDAGGLIARGNAIIKEGDKAGPNHEDMGVMGEMQAAGQARAAAQMNRRESDNSDKWTRVTFKGITLIVPNDVQPGELSDFAIALMKVTNTMKGAKLDGAALVAAFQEEVNH